MNGDGYGDLFVGAPESMTVGQVFVFHGGASGLNVRAATTLTGSHPSARLGISIAPGADIDGDGYSDLFVGATGDPAGAGGAFAYRGGVGGMATRPFVTETGPDGADTSYGFVVSIAGDADGDGRVALVVVAPGVFHNSGRMYFYAGDERGPGTIPVLVTGPDGQQNVFGWSMASAGRPSRARGNGVDALRTL